MNLEMLYSETDNVDENYDDIHWQFLKSIKIWLEKYYDSSQSTAIKNSKPIQSNKSLDSYVSTGHFLKNFHTNYHALTKLFQDRSVPYHFNVYDLACGPFTATISLLNYLVHTDSLNNRTFRFHFCDIDNWTMNHCLISNNGIIEFKIPCRYFPSKEIVGRDIITTFDIMHSIETKICTNGRFQTRVCMKRHHSSLRQEAQIIRHQNAVNLILCSYFGEGPNNHQYVKYISRIISNFNYSQKQCPTYIIYSHYDNRSRTHNSTSVKAKFARSLAFDIKTVDDSGDEEVPFSNCFYTILEVKPRVRSNARPLSRRRA